VLTPDKHIAFHHAPAIAEVFGNDPAAWSWKARGDHMRKQRARSARRHHLVIQAEHYGKTRDMRGVQRIFHFKGFAAIKLRKRFGTPDREHEKPPFL